MIGHPIHVVDKYHLFQEANKMVDEVRQLNIWLTQMGFIHADDIVKYGKIPKKFTKEEKEKMKKESLKPMQKYKNAEDNRLKTELVKVYTIRM